MNGFVGEFLILLGAYHWNPTYAVWAATGVILSAVYMLWMYQRVFLGEVIHEQNRFLPDLNLREKIILIPLIIAAFWMGIYSSPFLKRMESSVSQIINSAHYSTVALDPKLGVFSK